MGKNLIDKAYTGVEKFCAFLLIVAVLISLGEIIGRVFST